MRRILVCAALAGCAAQKRPPPQEQLKGIITADLDRAMVRPEGKRCEVW
jgi:hypothetical protein